VADNEHPERRDLEPRPATPPLPADPEQLKQFEQYQQFQQFLKFQEAQGQGGALVPTPPPGAPKTPLWKKILFSRGFRKLVLVVVVIIGVIWAYNHYFGPPPDDGHVTGGAGPGTGEEEGRRAENPNAGIQSVYTYIATGQSKLVCEAFFAPTGRADFARDFDGPDCATAAAKLAGTVDRSIPSPLVKWTGKDEVTVSSCQDLTLDPGTKPLGKFTFAKRSNGWTITRHEPEPDPCPAATATSGPPTSN
jgi:hypothetical protein